MTDYSILTPRQKVLALLVARRRVLRRMREEPWFVQKMANCQCAVCVEWRAATALANCQAHNEKDTSRKEPL